MAIFRAILVLLYVVLGGLYFMPALNIQAWGLYFFIAVGVFLAFMVPFRADESTDDHMGRLVIVGLLIVLGAGFLMLISSQMLRSDSHFKLLGEEKVVDYKAPLPPIDLRNAPLVDVSMAQRAAEKKLSEEAALGSQVELGSFEKQLVGDELVWVAFLEHRGFFKWLDQGATPGYVKVSANDASRVELVTEAEGKKLELKYLNSAFFGDNLERHIYLSGYASELLGPMVPEIDDNGKPYAVAAIYERQIAMSGDNVVGALVVDVQSGAIQRYALNDVPEWIDRIQPQSVVAEQLAARLYLINGWLNPSDKDRLALSGSLDLVYGTDGRAYFFAGHTSVAREGGLVSFSLIDSRTKESTRYTLSGVTESVAQAAAEGVMPEKQYRATNALPFSVEGVPTYVMALRDSTGIARAYALVSIEDFQKVAVAETLSAAARQYQAKLATDRTRLDFATNVDLKVATTPVQRMSAEVRGGNTTYLFVLEGHPGVMFAAGPDISDELALTREGDLVEVQFTQGPNRMVGLISFKNKSLFPDTDPVR